VRARGKAVGGRGRKGELRRAADRFDPRLRLLTLALLVGAAFLVVALSGSLSADAVRDRVDSLGAAGPLLFIPISACLTVALFPGPLLAGASGLLFGTALGTPVSIVSATLGATMAFSLSRWWAHDAVAALAGPRLSALRAWVGRRGFFSVLYARIAPGVPYSLVNYAAGLAPVLLRAFVAATAIGVAPRAFAYTALGGSLGDLRSPEAIVAVVVLVGMAVVGLALARRDLRRARPRPAPQAQAGSKS
jgi:uncharacterized membrane protein YdjX (TVP38/TMEM64 family)